MTPFCNLFTERPPYNLTSHSVVVYHCHFMLITSPQQHLSFHFLD